MKKYILSAGLLIALTGSANAQSEAKNTAPAPTQAAGADLHTTPQLTTPLQNSRSNAALLRDDAAKTKPVPATDASNQASPNPQLIQPAGNTAPTPYRTTQNTTTPGTWGNSVQPVNATSQEFNLGGQKAKSTIYYDNSGKMTGHKTTIQLGK